jgi:hypothetical protein
MLLPREISQVTCSPIEKSAESIVVVETSPGKPGRSHSAMKGGTLNSGYAYWISTIAKATGKCCKGI